MKHPLILIVFNRPEHTRRTIEALSVQQPPLVYVYQDGPRKDNMSDVAMCDEVKQTIERHLNWPCELHTFYSNFNRGCRDAVIYAITEVLKKHKTVIVVEDDIITSPAFYSYMCKALDYYENRKTVFSISGHSHSPAKFKVPDDYAYDVFASPRLFNWGWGTWADRWEQADWSFSYYDGFIERPFEQQAFCRGGDDLFPMLVDEKNGRSSAWDIQFAFAHFRNHAVSIVPCESYTYNIGQDGSGTHSHIVHEQNYYSSLNKNDKPVFLDNLYFDSRLINLLNSVFTARKRPKWQKIINYVARLIGRVPPYVIKKRVYAKE